MTREGRGAHDDPAAGEPVLFIAFSSRRGVTTMVRANAARAALENLAAGHSPERSRSESRTICVAPGTITTEGMQRNFSQDDRANWEAVAPLRGLGTAKEVSEVITFLASPSGSCISGTTVVIDSGADAC